MITFILSSWQWIASSLTLLHIIQWLCLHLTLDMTIAVKCHYEQKQVQKSPLCCSSLPINIFSPITSIYLLFSLQHYSCHFVHSLNWYPCNTENCICIWGLDHILQMTPFKNNYYHIIRRWHKLAVIKKMPPHIMLQSSTVTPISFWRQLHMKRGQIGWTRHQQNFAYAALITATPFRSQRTRFEFTPTKTRLSISLLPILQPLLKPTFPRYRIYYISLPPSHPLHFTCLFPRASRGSATGTGIGRDRSSAYHREIDVRE